MGGSGRKMGGGGAVRKENGNIAYVSECRALCEYVRARCTTDNERSNQAFFLSNVDCLGVAN